MSIIIEPVMPTTTEPECITLPVVNPDGTVLVYDMFVDGRWHGSRRTQDQCEQHFTYVRECRRAGKEIVLPLLRGHN